MDARGLRIAAPSDGTRPDAFLKWINEELPATQTPVWLGLPPDAERLLLTSNGKRALRNLLKMYRVDSDTGDDDEKPAVSVTEDAALERTAWMAALETTVQEYLSSLPEKVATPAAAAASANDTDPLRRLFAREHEQAAKLLATLRADLNALLEVCSGERKQTNHLRALIAAITKGVVPESWSVYAMPPSVGCTRWLADFAGRVRQFDSLDARSIRLGQLFQVSLFYIFLKLSSLLSNLGGQ